MSQGGIRGVVSLLPSPNDLVGSTSFGMVGSFGFLEGTYSSLVVGNCCHSFNLLLSGEACFELDARAGASWLLFSVARRHGCSDTGSDVRPLLVPFSTEYQPKPRTTVICENVLYLYLMVAGFSPGGAEVMLVSTLI